MGSTVIRSDKNDLLCCGCKQLVNKLHNKYCSACDAAAYNRSRLKRLKKIEDDYNEWLAKIKDKEYHPLTEEEWMDTCRYFKRCAYCDTREISVRSLFIDFKAGGRYAVWNVLPSCEICALAIKTTPNPFFRMNNIHNRDKGDKKTLKNRSQAVRLGYNITKLKRITDYLNTKM